MEFKGIQNNGQNNCFLNSILQILLHNKRFVQILQSLNKPKSTLIKTLSDLILRYRQDQSLDPADLRTFLCFYYSKVQKFQMNEPADCMEAFLAILEIIHEESACSPGDLCIAHQLYYYEVFEQYECECRATSEVLTWDFCTFSIEIYTDDLIKTTTQFEFIDLDSSTYSHVSESLNAKDQFTNFVKNQLSGTVLACPENCSKKKSARNIYITSTSQEVTFSLVWYKQPSFLQVCKIFSSIQTKIPHSSISDSFTEDLYLKGVVCYNKFHYFSYVFDRAWHKCDDVIIRRLNDYTDIFEDAVRSGYWPVALFYSTEIVAVSEVSHKFIEDFEKNCILLDIQKQFEEESVNLDMWQCKCSHLNPEKNWVCEYCLANRFSGFEWKCEKCGHLNSEVNKQCLNCQSFVLNPTQSSYHSKLTNFYYKSPSKSEKFQESNRFDFQGFRSVRFDREENKESIEKNRKNSDHIFINSSTVISKALGKTQSSNLETRYLCKICKKTFAVGDICKTCSAEHIYCKDCNRIFKINGQRCSCDLKSKTQRFFN